MNPKNQIMAYKIVAYFAILSIYIENMKNKGHCLIYAARINQQRYNNF